MRCPSLDEVPQKKTRSSQDIDKWQYSTLVARSEVCAFINVVRKKICCVEKDSDLDARSPFH